MYVNERALTFNDLAKAVQQSAGFGQVDLSSLNQLPLSGQVGESPLDQAIANAPLTVAGNTAAMPWGTLGLVAAGLILFGLVAGKR